METQQDAMIEMQPSAGVRGTLDYRLIIMRQLDRCGLTLARLPHETVMQNFNEPVGTTYKDIQNSFFDGVRLVEALIEPYRDGTYNETYNRLVAEYKNSEKKDIANLFFDRYAAVISLCARLGLLLEQTGEEVF